MKDYELLDAIGEIDEKYVKAATARKTGGRRVWVRFGAAVAGLCLVVAAVLAVPSLKTGKSPVIPDTSVSPEQDVLDPDDAIFIPEIEVPTGGEHSDMAACVVYRGGVYIGTENYPSEGAFLEDAFHIESLLGEYLGTSSGHHIDEWSKPEDYEKEFAGNVQGDLYAVKGYDTDFRIACRYEEKRQDGTTGLIIHFLERLNGIELRTGKDVFEERLHIKDRVASILWQSHEDWNENWIAADMHTAEFPKSVWDAFLEAADNGDFVYTVRENDSIYFTPHQAHMILIMEDGTTVRLRLIEGGYVGYDVFGLANYLVKIPEATFNAVYDACGGTHPVG